MWGWKQRSFKYDLLLALMMPERVMHQGMWQHLDAGKDKETDSVLQPREETVLWHFIFRTFDVMNYKLKLYCFTSLSLGVVTTIRNRYTWLFLFLVPTWPCLPCQPGPPTFYTHWRAWREISHQCLCRTECHISHKWCRVKTLSSLLPVH
jgi:hypothetical protein